MSNLSIYHTAAPCMVPLRKVPFQQQFSLTSSHTDITLAGQSNFQFLIRAVQTGLVQVKLKIKVKKKRPCC